MPVQDTRTIANFSPHSARFWKHLTRAFEFKAGAGTQRRVDTGNETRSRRTFRRCTTKFGGKTSAPLRGSDAEDVVRQHGRSYDEDDFSMSEAQAAAAEAEVGWDIAADDDDAEDPGGLGFTKLSDDVLCCNHIHDYFTARKKRFQIQHSHVRRKAHII